MKLYAILFIGLVLTSCGAKRKSQVAETKPALAVEGDSLPTRCVAILLTGIQNGEADLSDCFVTPALARKLDPQHTAKMNDQEITKTMLEPLTSRFKYNLRQLHDEARNHQVNLAMLRIQGIDLKPSNDPPLVPRAFVVELTDGKLDYEVPVTGIQDDGKWYILEILMTTGVFGE